jgi:hypothetical protein
MMPITSVIFRAFRAIDEPESCEKFIRGHRAVLEAYGITMITSNNAGWFQHKNTFVILAETPEDKRELGGVRVQIADGDLPLPIVHAVGKVDDKIHDIIEKDPTQPIAEACGLWNSKEIAGHGFSFFLLRAAIALAYQVKVKKLYALAAPVTVKMCLDAGFRIETGLGKDGFFNYPKLDLVATAMVIDNLRTMEYARDEDKKHIFNLMNHPLSRLETSGPKGNILIDYRLNLAI